MHSQRWPVFILNPLHRFLRVHYPIHMEHKYLHQGRWSANNRTACERNSMNFWHADLWLVCPLALVLVPQAQMVPKIHWAQHIRISPHSGFSPSSPIFFIDFCLNLHVIRPFQKSDLGFGDSPHLSSEQCPLPLSGPPCPVSRCSEVPTWGFLSD